MYDRLSNCRVIAGLISIEFKEVLESILNKPVNEDEIQVVQLSMEHSQVFYQDLEFKVSTAEGIKEVNDKYRIDLLSQVNFFLKYQYLITIPFVDENYNFSGLELTYDIFLDKGPLIEGAIMQSEDEKVIVQLVKSNYGWNYKVKDADHSQESYFSETLKRYKGRKFKIINKPEMKFYRKCRTLGIGRFRFEMQDKILRFHSTDQFTDFKHLNSTSGSALDGYVDITYDHVYGELSLTEYYPNEECAEISIGSKVMQFIEEFFLENNKTFRDSAISLSGKLDSPYT